jgi:hypothetical protein
MVSSQMNHNGESVFFLATGPKFRPEKYDFGQYRGIFHGKNGPNSQDFTGNKFQIATFYDKFHWVAKNRERFWLFLTFMMWPNLAK